MKARALCLAVAMGSLPGCASSTVGTPRPDAADAAPMEAGACPSPAGVRAGGACSTPAGVDCMGAVGCFQCGAFDYLRYAPSCACIDGRWACSHADCGPPPNCDVYADPACTRFVACDAGAPDAAADAPADRADAPADARCPPGTCYPPGRTACEPPGGPVGNACCGCGDDGLCSSPCMCAAPDTPVATPSGDRPIASLRAGDLVYSVDGGALRAVAVRAVQRVPVTGHRVVRVALGHGAVLRVSALHPTADGRTFGDLRAGDLLDGRAVLSAEVVDYPFDATWDILPDSDTGTYVAGGALIGTTMRRAAEVVGAARYTCGG